MADDRRRAPNWRTTGAKGAGGRGGPQIEPGKKRPGAGKRFLVLAAVLALVGVIAGFFAFVREPPKPIFLGLAVTEYANPNFAPNPWGQQDSEALRQRFGADSEQAVAGQEKKALLQKLKDLVARTSKAPDNGRPVVVHLCALGVSFGGKAYLLPADAEPSAPSTWLPLDDVLNVLRDSKGKCLLLLDIARPVADARLGLLVDDAATAVHNELKAAHDAGTLKFLVLTSCAAGQFSHTSPELRRSVFGYFLEQALLGRADGWNKKSTDQAVSARELAEYVRSQTAQWASHQRLSSQTPTLYGTGDDFFVITPKQKPEPTLPDLEEARPYLPWLTEAWAERDRWLADGSFRLAPRTFRQLEQALLRTEQRWLAGVDEALLQREFESEKKKLVDRKNEFLPQKFTPHSLAEAKRLGIKEEAAVASALRGFMARLQSKTPPTPAEFAEALKSVQKPPPEVSPTDAMAWTGLNALNALSDPTQEQLKTFDDYFGKFLPLPRPTELLLLTYLLDHDKRQLGFWSDLPTAKALVLQSGTAAERAAAIDARTYPWVADALHDANKLRRDGLLALSTGQSTEREGGVRSLDAAMSKYREVDEAATELERALARLDEAMIVLPALAQRPPSDQQLWNATHGPALKLQPMLVPPAKPALPPIAPIKSQSETMSAQLTVLRKRFGDVEVDQVIGRAGNPVEIRQALDSPLWAGANRAKLFLAARDKERELIKEAQAKSIKLTPDTPLPPTTPVSQPRPDWRARVAIDLLKLDGVTATKPLEDLLAEATGKTEPEAWEKLGQEIRKAWAVQLPERFSAAGAPSAAQRQMGFIVHPFDVSSLPLPAPQDRFQRDPAPLLRREQTVVFWQALAERRYFADAAAFKAFTTRKEMTDYAKALSDVALDLQARKP